jgi:predicted ABC-type ATPase
MLSEKQNAIVDKAVAYAKKNRTKICRLLTDKEVYLAEVEPVSVFMSGSPGAGKTETSIELVASITKNGGKVLRLDPDDLRNSFEEYNGSNSFLFQRPVTMLVERAMDMVIRNKQSFLLDGTLSSLGVAEKNIKRSLDKNRDVVIIFVYQRPVLAWEFVKAREKVEGRRILPCHFVEQFFGSQNVVEAMKVKYKNRIAVDLLIKDNDGNTRSYHSNVSSLKPYIKPMYTVDEVEKIINTNGV